MVLEKIAGQFAVCKLSAAHPIDLYGDFVFLSKTDSEISLVCAKEKIPTRAIGIEADWSMLRIEGKLAFSMVGVISEISAILKEADVSIFVLSTFDTDYIMIKQVDYRRAKAALEREGHTLK